ncbi:heterotrimeric G protein alpha subunit [Heliocybe sulcata]|uniref:Guanine nucleotide-binding protein subunit alpha n=1 Tax=Heliocybe sulcata TaxID=5364 RepID=A0A5C3MJ19_9AGAM|nr:heterotrimeric G protein alpha subunit [Heliocybe sulcata]
MGICMSSPEQAAAKARSDEIDQGLEQDAKRLKRECKILLLGAGESGKSTIVKQMKIIHQDGFTRDELSSFRHIVYQNLLDSAQAVVLAMRKFGIDCEGMENRANTDRILDYKIENSPAFVFSDDIAQAIHNLWKDASIPRLMEYSSNFYLMDNASYFFQEAPRIGSQAYLPTEADVLRVREKSTGVKETRFSIGQLSIHMFDVGGQRSERRKWIHCFESVTSIIFCTALSEYDQVLLEESKQNRMEESLVLFESVINSRWFLRTSIILFLNKIDVFKAKIPKVPLAKYFPEYTGGADINKATKYILWKFMQANRARLSVYPHVTQATDTRNIRLVFAAVKETILQNALKDSGIL